MASSPASLNVPEPIAIFKLARRFLLYDATVVSYIRQKYSICGVLIGSLPQAPQQNVFLGLPLELMPEEARLLVEKGVAHVFDDVAEHKRNFLGNGLSMEDRKAYQMALRKQGVAAAREADKRTNERKKAALQQKLGTENWNDIPTDMLKPSSNRKAKKSEGRSDDDVLFSSAPTSVSPKPEASQGLSNAGALTMDRYAITPTESYSPLQVPENPAVEVHLPETPASYPLFRHLHESGYFLAPGLRFGCQYMAYPGDPLRFHSHFLCNGMDWQQEFSLLDLVGGGRLGTGVKKGFLIGGQVENSTQTKSCNNDDGAINATVDDTVRCFCIEWAGM